MLLAIYAIALALISGTILWFSISRWWHAAAVAILWITLSSLLTRRLVGDVFRYLLAPMFPEGPERQEGIALTSIASSLVVSLVLAAALQRFLRWVLKELGLEIKQ
jgi:hypothetical protein